MLWVTKEKPAAIIPSETEIMVSSENSNREKRGVKKDY
jgi:hypothetical protein